MPLMPVLPPVRPCRQECVCASALALPLRFAPGHFCWEGAEAGALMWVARSLLPEDSRLTSELLPSQRLFLLLVPACSFAVCLAGVH